MIIALVLAQWRRNVVQVADVVLILTSNASLRSHEVEIISFSLSTISFHSHAISPSLFSRSLSLSYL